MAFSVAKQVTTTQQTMKGKEVHVKLVETKTQNTETIETSGKEFPAVWSRAFLQEPQRMEFISTFRKRKMVEEKSKK